MWTKLGKASVTEVDVRKKLHPDEKDPQARE